MPPQTRLPRPEGNINFSYSPMSPPNWGIVASNIQIFVYRDVKTALRAMLQATTTIQAQRLEAGTSCLFNDYLYFRGQSDITQRLLPTRLRGLRREPMRRKRFRVDEGPPGQDPRDQFGDWYERVEPMRVIEDSAADLPEEKLRQRDAREWAAVERAAQIPEIARLDNFQRRAAARHYSGAPSELLDVSTNPEVAAFFATGGGSEPPSSGQIGILWAIDLNVLEGLFSFEIVSVSNGLKIRLREERDKWGDNKRIFEEFGIQPTSLELTSLALPFRRPVAQSARFLSLRVEEGAPFPPLMTELTWWSIIERGAYGCAFIHDGHTYENQRHNITRAALLPNDELLAIALAEETSADCANLQSDSEGEKILSVDLGSKAPVVNLPVAFSPRGPYREVTSKAPWVLVFALRSTKGAPTRELALREARTMASAYDVFLSQVDDFLINNGGYWIRERHTPVETSYDRMSSVRAWGIVRIPSQFDPQSLPAFADIGRLGKVDNVYVQPWDTSTHEVVIHFHRLGTKGDNKESQRVITRGLRFDEIFDLDAARNQQTEKPAAFFRDLLPFLHSRLKTKFGGIYTLEDNVFYITYPKMGDNFLLPPSWWTLINSSHERETSDATLAKGVARIRIHNSVEENVKDIFGE